MVERNRQHAKWLLRAVFISCAAGFAHSASAQLVSGTGDVQPGSVQTPNWTVGGDLTVGDTATGALTIDAGATVSNDLATIGNLNGAIGTLTVSGRDGAGAASTWTSTGLVSVGVESGSQGTLKVQAGGQARSDAGIIGRDSGSVGTVTVSGVGSVWELSTINSFQIGTAGSGTLRIDDGGAVHSGQGIIGWQPGGNGRVTVTGARSVWDPLNNIYVGFEGTGELVQDGAAVHTQAERADFRRVDLYRAPAGRRGHGQRVQHDGQRLDPEGERPHRDRLGGHGHADHRQGRDRGRRRRYLDRRRRRLDRHVAPAWRCRRSWRAGDRLRRQGAGTTSFDWNGGILRAIRDQNDFLNGFATQAIGANGAWFDTNTYDVVMGTAFSGASSFNKLGAGTLTLSGNSAAFTGNTAIRAGTLQVDGILGGPVNAGGRAADRNGTRWRDDQPGRHRAGTAQRLRHADDRRRLCRPAAAWKSARGLAPTTRRPTSW